jgi:hypothetical protein
VGGEASTNTSTCTPHHPQQLPYQPRVLFIEPKGQCLGVAFPGPESGDRVAQVPALVLQFGQGRFDRGDSLKQRGEAGDRSGAAAFACLRDQAPDGGERGVAVRVAGREPGEEVAQAHPRFLLHPLGDGGEGRSWAGRSLSARLWIVIASPPEPIWIKSTAAARQCARAKAGSAPWSSR